MDSSIAIEDAAAVVAAANTLKIAGSSFQILPERAAPMAAFPGRNVMLFGDANHQQRGGAATDTRGPDRLPMTQGSGGW